MTKVVVLSIIVGILAIAVIVLAIRCAYLSLKLKMYEADEYFNDYGDTDY